MAEEYFHLRNSNPTLDGCSLIVDDGEIVVCDDAPTGFVEVARYIVADMRSLPRNVRGRETERRLQFAYDGV